MSKYGSGLSTVDVCKLEVGEMEEILVQNNVPPADRQTLKEMLIEAYFQLHKAYASGRVMERHMEKLPIAQLAQEILEEEQKVPFDIIIEKENDNE